MPRLTSLPTLLDEYPVLSISQLKRLGFLNPKKNNYDTVYWHCEDGTRRSIQVYINMLHPEPSLELNYRWEGEQVTYEVKLVALPSNLGKGQDWYFLCPKTGRRCRKLHWVGKYLLHRTAFSGALYSRQQLSEQQRAFVQELLQKDATLEELIRKCRKTHYRGKPTKTYLALLNKLRRLYR